MEVAGIEDLMPNGIEGLMGVGFDFVGQINSTKDLVEWEKEREGDRKGNKNRNWNRSRDQLKSKKRGRGKTQRKKKWIYKFYKD